AREVGGDEDSLGDGHRLARLLQGSRDSLSVGSAAGPSYSSARALVSASSEPVRVRMSPGRRTSCGGGASAPPPSRLSASAVAPVRTRRLSCARVKPTAALDRKSTRLNSSHVKISYAVFCLKKKKKQTAKTR